MSLGVRLALSIIGFAGALLFATAGVFVAFVWASGLEADHLEVGPMRVSTLVAGVVCGAAAALLALAAIRLR